MAWPLASCAQLSCAQLRLCFSFLRPSLKTRNPSDPLMAATAVTSPAQPCLLTPPHTPTRVQRRQWRQSARASHRSPSSLQPSLTHLCLRSHIHTHSLPPSPSLAPSPLTQQADATGGRASAGKGGLKACLEWRVAGYTGARRRVALLACRYLHACCAARTLNPKP